MDTIKRLKEISFNRLVHAEVAYFMSMALNEMQAVGAEALQVKPQQLEEFARLVDQLTNNLRKNTACEETGEIQQLVTQQRKLFTYLRDSCKGMQHVPLPQYSAAARQLYPQLVPHVRIGRVPQMQLVTIIDAVLFDLAKQPFTALVEQLSLTGIVEELTKNNLRINELVNHRTRTRASRRTDLAREARAQLVQLYDYLSTRIWALSIIHPTPQLDRVISNLNAHVGATRTAYNRRVAQSKRARKKADKVE